MKKTILTLLSLLPVLSFAQDVALVDSIHSFRCCEEAVVVDSTWLTCTAKATYFDTRDIWQKLEYDIDFSNNDSNNENLSFEVFALGFFRDNEYDSDMTKGYSLPGAIVRPAFVYDKKIASGSNLPKGKNKHHNIHLELGAHALLFDGANKYPCYAYHDIGKWKGNQYQSGAHILPWFRAQAVVGNFAFVLGDIYGGASHAYATPLYNNEQTLSADPEMGTQIVYKAPNITGEAYVNWQSYQFEEDTHQEAFTVGIGAIPYTNYNNGSFSFPVRVLAQHRGGEQDIPSLDLGVQTIANASVGVRFSQVVPFIMTNWELQANILGCYQQAGKLWPFESGLAYNAEGRMLFGRDLMVTVGEFYAPKNFVSIYGNHFFSTLSTKTGKNHPGLNTVYLMTDYSHQISKGYVLGANAELYKVNATGLNEFNFSFGIYLRLKPSFKLK